MRIHGPPLVENPKLALQDNVFGGVCFTFNLGIVFRFECDRPKWPIQTVGLAKRFFFFFVVSEKVCAFFKEPRPFFCNCFNNLLNTFQLVNVSVFTNKGTSVSLSLPNVRAIV